MLVLKEKLKKFKHELRSWNKEVFGIIRTKKKNIIKEIRELDKSDEDSNLD